MSTRVLIVDDHRMFRDGLRARLAQEPDFEVAGEAASVAEAVAFLERESVSIVILDIRMPQRSGIELTRIVRQRWPDLRILVLSGYDFDQYVQAMARAGVHGYLLKEAPQDDLVAALRVIAAGGVVLPPSVASKVMRGYGAPRKRERMLFDLTLRELDILELLYQGLKNSDIGERLGVSPRTVETHVRSIIGKLGARTRTEAVRIASDRGLIK